MFDLSGKALTTLAIPSEIDGFPVLRIESLGGNFGMGSTTDIIVKRVVVPDGVKSIGDNVLYGWTSFSGTLIIPASVQSLGRLVDGSPKVIIKKGSPLKEEFDNSTEDAIWGVLKSNITFEE